MANKRMFSLSIIDTDTFLEMPQSSQLFYFHLSMRADDEGFVSNPKKIMRMIGTSEDDLKILIAKRFILTFESGVVVIKHWLIHNTIRMDRFNPTTYQKEKSALKIKDNGSYTELATTRQPNGNQMEPQVKLSKVNLIKDKLEGEDAPLPPSLINKGFFKDKEYRECYLKENSIQIDLNELDKFVSYWTEPNKSGTKVRWELEKTFDVKRRIATWIGNNFGGKETPKVITVSRGEQ